MGISSLIMRKRKQITDIAREHGATNISVFGSAARGEIEESSDIDFLVEMKPGSTLLDIIALKQDLEDLLGRSVDIVTNDSISPYIKDEALKETVIL